MRIAILVEDKSGEILLKAVLPKLLGEYKKPNTWIVSHASGLGRLPKDLDTNDEPNKKTLFGMLPSFLNAHGKENSRTDAVVVVLDADRRSCSDVLTDLEVVKKKCESLPNTLLFCIAIEEMEAWYFGDRQALLAAYPRAKENVLNQYVQDSVCDTWELLADAIYPGGVAAIKKKGFKKKDHNHAGQVKCEWAEKIAPLLDPDRNVSPSFGKLRDGLRRLVAKTP
jgi:hypothetical protein